MPESLDTTLPPFTDAFFLWSAASRTSQVRSPAPPRPGRADGKQLTIWVRWNRLVELPEGEILRWPADRAAVTIFCAQREGRRWLGVTLAMDAKDRPLDLGVRLAALGDARLHDLMLRYAGCRVELLVDGVLVDEEWPMGSLGTATGEIDVGAGAQAAREGAGGFVDQVAGWNRALTDDEVQLLAGESAGLVDRERQILGPLLPVGQYWSPRGFNTHVGDCMPFFHAGRFHLFYLFDRRHHQSKWGLGAHQWAHISTTDLVNWEHHPLAIAITDEIEGSICTGSVFFHAGVYHGFYSVRMADGSASPLCAATSKDGIHFTKHRPFAYLTTPYQPQSARDPVVFREEATGLFHMLLTTSLANPPVADRGGCLAHLVSHDLRQWEQREPLILTDYPGEPECPDYFEWHGWYYLLFSHEGVAHYRMSRGPLGPWQKPAADTFDGPDAKVMKTASFTGDRRIGVAFVSRPGEAYAGRAIFREILQAPNGTLHTQWPTELAEPLQKLGADPVIQGVSP